MVMTIFSNTLTARAEAPLDLVSIPDIEPTVPSVTTDTVTSEQQLLDSDSREIHSSNSDDYNIAFSPSPPNQELPQVADHSLAVTIAPHPAQTHEVNLPQANLQPDNLAATNQNQVNTPIVQIKGIDNNSSKSNPIPSAIAAQPIPGTVATSADLLRLQPQTPEPSTQSANQTDTTIAQRDLDIRRSPVGVPSYIGIGGNIGLSSGDDNTTLGDGGFVVNSKIRLSDTLSLRPSVIFGNDAVFLIPLTYDFVIPRVDPFEPIRFAPFAGGGVAISTDDDNNIGFLLTLGVDVPISRTFVANAALNVGFIEDTTDFGLMLGVGYVFGK